VTNEAIIQRIQYDGLSTSGVEVFKNGVSGGVSPARDMINPTLYSWLGSDGVDGRKLVGNLAKVIMYDRVLTPEESAAVEGWRAAFYGIVLP
jgi:hypothetical protein